MKAACLILCLSLPCAILENKFNQKRQVDRYLVVNPLDYIDQYQFNPSNNRAGNSQESNSDIASYIKQYTEALGTEEQPRNQWSKAQQLYNEASDEQVQRQKPWSRHARLNKQRHESQERDNSRYYMWKQIQINKDISQEKQYNGHDKIKPERRFNLQKNIIVRRYNGRDNSEEPTYINEEKSQEQHLTRYMKRSSIANNYDSQDQLYGPVREHVKRSSSEQQQYNSQVQQVNKQEQQYDVNKQRANVKQQPIGQEQQINSQETRRASSQEWRTSNQEQFGNPKQNWQKLNQRYKVQTDDQVEMLDKKQNSINSQHKGQQGSKTMLYDVVPSYGDYISWRGLALASGPNSLANNQKDIEKIFADAYKTIHQVSGEDKEKYHKTYKVAASSKTEDIHLNATELIKKNQYNVEEHTVKTEDGYLLTMFRIQPNMMTRDLKKSVVLMMNGLLGSADDWLLLGPGKGLPYLLADAGHEVWLGNSRGSKYSRRHVSKHPAQSDFWQFSIDEIALQDLPTMIDYILSTSQQEKMFYVGYSQGTTAFFALASTLPSYNDKIIMMYALSPMAYMAHVRSPMMRMMAPGSAFFDRLDEQLGEGEFLPGRGLLATMGGAMCDAELGCRNVCSNVNLVMSGFNVDNVEGASLAALVGRTPAGASVRQLRHYGQLVASGDFARYHYGADVNRQVYGSPQPPQYSLGAVSVPVALLYGELDWLAHPADVARLARELPQVADSYRAEGFGSLDLQLAERAPQLVYTRIIASMQRAEAAY